MTSLNIETDKVGEEKHIPEVYQCIRTIKERTQETRNTIPIKNIPTRVIIEMLVTISM